MTRYTTELIPDPAPPPAAEAPDTAAARDTAEALRTAGYAQTAAEVHALAAALDNARRERCDIAASKRGANEKLGLAQSALAYWQARAEAAEAERNALRVAMPDANWMEKYAEAMEREGWSTYAARLRNAAAAIRAALAALAADGGAARATGGAIECPHARSDMTPCWQKDGDICLSDDGVCVGCGLTPEEAIGGA